MIARSIRVALLSSLVVGGLACGPSRDDDAGTDVTRTDARDSATDTGNHDGQSPDVSDVQAQRDVTDVQQQADVQDAGLDATDDVTSDVPVADATDGSTADALDGTTADVVTDATPGDVAADGPATDGGAMCPAPIRALALTDTYTGSLTGATGLVETTSCQANTHGGENVFTLHVATATGVIVSTDSATTTIDTVVSIRSTCGSLATEIACDDDSGSGTTSVVRAALAPGDYFVIVNGYNGANGPYQLTVSTFAATAPNAACNAPTTLTPGTPLTGQDTTGGGGPASACDLANPGAQLFYAVSIPSGQAATVTATPTSTTAHIEVRALDSCAASTCSAADTETGVAATVVATNASATAHTEIFSVSSTSATTPVQFSIGVTLAPIPYIETNIPTACDDLSTGATTLTGVTTDDSHSPIAALPFSLQYFGMAATNYSATSNGYVQLWPSGTGTPSTAYNNVAVPDPSDPHGIVAALWDDLDVNTGAVVRVATLGTAPSRRFVAEWNNWTFHGDTSTLRFQIKFYETTNVIEFHYCTLTDSDDAERPTGSEATVGIANLAATAGIQHSLNTAGSISTANALRYTPAP